MASNQTIPLENLKQSIINLITNWFTTTKEALETSGDVTNPFEFWEALFDAFEAQALQILEENGIETEALVNAFNTARARSQSSSDTEIQESMDNLRQQAEEIFTDARIQELTEELRIYYVRILTHESLTDMFGFSLQIGYLPYFGPILVRLPFAAALLRLLMNSIQSNPEFMAYVIAGLHPTTAELAERAEEKEKLEEFLTKFLEVETALNDQHD